MLHSHYESYVRPARQRRRPDARLLRRHRADDGLAELARDADLFLCEATLAQPEQRRSAATSPPTRHSTPSRSSGAQRLVVIHRPDELAARPTRRARARRARARRLGAEGPLAEQAVALDGRMVAVVGQAVAHPGGRPDPRACRGTEAASRRRARWISSLRRAISPAARSSPLFHGSTSATATREPGGAAALDHRREVPRGVLDRPPLHDVVDAALHDEHVGAVEDDVERRAIWSVRSPYTAVVRNSSRGVGRAAHHCHWLRSSGCRDPRAHGRGQDPTAASRPMIESPTTATTIGHSTRAGSARRRARSRAPRRCAAACRSAAAGRRARAARSPTASCRTSSASSRCDMLICTRALGHLLRDRGEEPAAVAGGDPLAQAVERPLQLGAAVACCHRRQYSNSAMSAQQAAARLHCSPTRTRPGTATSP